MNEKQTEILDAEPKGESSSRAVAQQQTGAVVAANSPMAMMMAAVNQGVPLEKVEQMLDLQERWERREAEKAYNVAFAAFKAEAVRIIKGREVTQGPLSGKSYAELHDVVDAVTPALSKHGLSTSWKLTKDEAQWIEVTCTLKHVHGHSESVSMGGPPDTGGAKNVLQARASTKTYLERYTLKSICGVAEGGEDNDGNGSPKNLADWVDEVKATNTVDALTAVSKVGARAFKKAQDSKGYALFAAEVQKHGAQLKKGPTNA